MNIKVLLFSEYEHKAISNTRLLTFIMSQPNAMYIHKSLGYQITVLQKWKKIFSRKKGPDLFCSHDKIE